MQAQVAPSSVQQYVDSCSLRTDMPGLFQAVHSMQCVKWQENTVLVSKFVQDATRMVRAASWVMNWTSDQPSWLEQMQCLLLLLAGKDN